MLPVNPSKWWFPLKGPPGSCLHPLLSASKKGMDCKAMADLWSRKLFDRGNHSEVLIHGMGASITKALHVTQDEG